MLENCALSGPSPGACASRNTFTLPGLWVAYVRNAFHGMPRYLYAVASVLMQQFNSSASRCFWALPLDYVLKAWSMPVVPLYTTPETVARWESTNLCIVVSQPGF